MVYSIAFDNDLIRGVELIDINLLKPHEKIIERKKASLAKFIKSYDSYYITSSIVCCHKSLLIIDGHHRYFALKELGFKKAPRKVLQILLVHLGSIFWCKLPAILFINGSKYIADIE